MRSPILVLTILIISTLHGFGQSKSYDIDFTDPESVVKAIFYAAQSKDFGIMQCLCDPYGEGDGDTKRLCEISSIAKKVGPTGSAENGNQDLAEFVQIFQPGRINGEITYETYKGSQLANVPFYFKHPGGEGRSNESMKLVKRHGNWYLLSF